MQPLAFLLSQVDGPADKTATIAAPDQAKTTVTFDFPGDYQASSGYRRQLATVLMSHVLAAAYEDALAKEGAHAANQG